MRKGQETKPLPVKILSAGIRSRKGEKTLDGIIKIGWERGLNLKNHRAIPFDIYLERRTNLVLTMESMQTEIITRRFPSMKNKTCKLNDFLYDSDVLAPDIEDPSKTDIDGTRQIANQIDDELNRIFPGLVEILLDKKRWKKPLIGSAKMVANDMDLS